VSGTVIVSEESGDTAQMVPRKLPLKGDYLEPEGVSFFAFVVCGIYVVKLGQSDPEK
jgi:hypothetical protein